MKRILEIYLLAIYLTTRPIKKYFIRQWKTSYFAAIMLQGLFLLMIVLFLILESSIGDLLEKNKKIIIALISALTILNEYLFHKYFKVLKGAMLGRQYIGIKAVRISSNFFAFIYIFGFTIFTIGKGLMQLFNYIFY